VGHSEASGEDAGELIDAFCAGRNALNALKSGAEMFLISCSRCNPSMVFRSAENDSFEIGQVTECKSAGDSGKFGEAG
jgi:hypothetical protein